jgi:hypothetical protein
MQKIKSGQIISVLGKKIEQEEDKVVQDQEIQYKLFFIKIEHNQYHLFCFNDFNDYEFFDAIIINGEECKGNSVFTHDQIVSFFKSKVYQVENETIEDFVKKAYKLDRDRKEYLSPKLFSEKITQTINLDYFENPVQEIALSA